MKTIKAKDAKFGRFYEYDRTGRIRCVHEDSVDTPATFADRYGRIMTIHGVDITELPAECDSFDWQPAAESNPNGVRWFVGKWTGRYVFMSHEDGDMCFKPGRKEISPSLIDDLAKRPDIKEITTAEALNLIGANGWTEGVARAKELAGIVDVVEHPITEGSVWRIRRNDYIVVKEDKGWIGRNVHDGLGACGHRDNIEDVFGSVRPKAVWVSDAEPAPKEANTVLTDLVSGKWKESEEVRWYLDEDEYVNLLQGYGPSGELTVCLDSGESENGNNANEERCEKDTRLTTAQVLCRLARAGHNDAWNKARKLAGMSEQEAYLAGQSVCGLSVGDTVRVTWVAADDEMGWGDAWPNCKVADSMPVTLVSDAGITVDSHCSYPFFVLEKIETPPEATPVETPVEPAADHGFAVGDWFKWNDEVRKISGIDGDHVNTECGHRHFAGHITKVTFRPFANAAEFEPFRDEWYRIKSTGMMFRISHYNDTAVDSHSYDWLLSNCEFASGRPCGVEVAL